MAASVPLFHDRDTFLPSATFGWQHLEPAPPLVHFVSSFAIATAKLEIERVVAALIAPCQNWASANCWSRGTVKHRRCWGVLSWSAYWM